MNMKILLTAAIAAALTASCAQFRDRMAGPDRSPSATASTAGPAKSAVRGSEMSAAAQGAQSDADGMFRQLDRNDDGFISRDEARGSPHERDFNALDTNNDGRLSREEHAAGMSAGMAPRAGATTPRAAPSTGGAGGSGGMTR